MAAAQAMVFINAALESGENMDLLAQTMLFKALAQSSQVSMEWGENYTRSFTQTQHKTTVQSGADINMRTTGNFTTQGVKVEAANNLNVDAGGEINIEGSTSINESSYSETTEGGIFEDDDVYSGSSSSHHNEGDVLASGSSGSGRTTMSSKKRQTYTGAHLSGPQAARLLSESTIHLNAGESSYCSQDLSQSGNIFMKHNSNSGYQSITHSMCKFSVTPEIQARQGIRISLTDSLDALGQDPKTAWIKELSLTTDVEWVHLQNAYKEWDYETNQLSAPVAALIAIGIGFATGGTGSTVAGAMLSAAVGSVTTQATISLINNNFDLGKVFKDLGSKEYLKSLLTSVVTAGLIAGVCPTAAAGSNTAAGAKDNLACFITHAKKNIIRTGVSGAINGKFDFVDMLKNIAVDTVGELAANEIGASRSQDGYWTHKLKHGLVEGGLGAVLRYDDDPVKGFVAGAAGAIVSEVIAEGMSKNIGNETFAAYEVDCQQEGIAPTKEGYQAAFRKRLDVAKDVARLGGAVAGAVAGDVSIGSRMANNAIDNNFARNNEELVQEACEIVWMAHETKDILQKEGHVSAFGRLGIKIETSADGKVIFRAADDSTFNSAKEALDHVLSDIPNLRASLGDVTKDLCAFGDIVVDETAKEVAKTAARKAAAHSAPAAIQTGDVLAQMMDGGVEDQITRGRLMERTFAARSTSPEPLQDTVVKRVERKLRDGIQACHDAREKVSLDSSAEEMGKAAFSYTLESFGKSVELIDKVSLGSLSTLSTILDKVGDCGETLARRGWRAVTGDQRAGQVCGETLSLVAAIANPSKIMKGAKAVSKVPGKRTGGVASSLPICSSTKMAEEFVASRSARSGAGASSSGAPKVKRETRIDGTPIIRDRHGKVKGVTNTQDHHIISDKHNMTADHPLWDLAGMTPNDPYNRMLLPNVRGAQSGTNKRSIHQGRHLDSVNKELGVEMDKILQKGKLSDWTQSQFRDALRGIIRDEYKMLKSGERKLNKHHR